MDLPSYEQFLASLTKDSSLAFVKNVEMDLRGDLNPTGDLHHLFFVEKRWLNFTEFFLYYLKQHGGKLKSTLKPENWKAFMHGLQARLYRTQFGFLTEYHAFLLAKEIFTIVQRDPALDKKGVDFQIIYNNQNYNIHIFVDTERAWYFRRFKSTHKEVDKEQGIHVNLPYALESNRFNSLHYLPNGFGIYQRDYFEYLKKEMDLGHIHNNNIIGTTEWGFIYGNPEEDEKISKDS